MRNEDPTPERVKGEHEKRKKMAPQREINRSIEEWGVKWLEAMKGLRAENTVDNYGVMLYNLNLYQEQHGILEPEHLTKAWNDKWMQWLGLERELVESSVGALNKNLKQFCKWLNEQGGVMVPEDWRQFPVYSSPPQKFFLEISELEKFYNADLSKYPGREKARDLFCFQARTGQRVSDLYRTENFMIFNNTIFMRAHKNQGQIAVPMTKITREIWERYDGRLPVMAEQRYNRALKEALKQAGINRMVEKVTLKGKEKKYEKVPLYEVITNHDAIKTFCTNAVEMGMTVHELAVITGKTPRTIERTYVGKTTARTAMNSMKRAFGA